MPPTKEKLKVLITVKTYPIPSEKYDELVCTAGVTERGEFIRLYPINFRNLPFDQQYKKYQWIEVDAVKHTGWDARKESYRPDCDTLRLGKKIPPQPGNWSERARYALACKALSLEELAERQEQDNTSLGIFRPKIVRDLVISHDEAEWPAKFIEALKQNRLFETRGRTRVPPRKVPFKFHYEFECDDPRCTGHRMMIEDWEVGAHYWRLIDDYGKSPDEAAQGVKQKFLHEMCGPSKDTHFYVGTILAHPKRWVVIGVFWPNRTTK